MDDKKKERRAIKPLYYERVEWAAKCRHGLSATERMVLMILAMKCDNTKPTESKVSRGYIAGITGLGLRTVDRALRVLVEKKLIKRNVYHPPPTVTQHTYGSPALHHTHAGGRHRLGGPPPGGLPRILVRLQARRDKEPALPETIDVLTATQEASRAAHRWRDAASAQYEAGNHGLASTSSGNKRYFYRLKDQGIVHLHKTGVLHYIGASPQGWRSMSTAMAACPASIPPCIRPASERVPVPDHPEVLMVPAKKRQVRIADVEHTLGCLPAESDGYERSASPEFGRQQRTCFELVSWDTSPASAPCASMRPLSPWDDIGAA